MSVRTSRLVGVELVGFELALETVALKFVLVLERHEGLEQRLVDRGVTAGIAQLANHGTLPIDVIAAFANRLFRLDELPPGNIPMHRSPHDTGRYAIRPDQENIASTTQ